MKGFSSDPNPRSHPRCRPYPHSRRAIPTRVNGVLISDRTGETVPYALFGLDDRGEWFVPPGVPVYEANGRSPAPS